MATINLEISKEKFDAAVPAAKEPKGYIFARMEPFIKEEMELISANLLGDVGIEAANSEPEGRLSKLIISIACQKAFAEKMRSLDLVITSTGFGVVSTNDTAPASKMRVDALDGELRVSILRHKGFLMSELFKVDGWYQQAPVPVDSLFYHFFFLTQFAGMESPVAKDWEIAAPLIVEADAFLRKHISDEYMDELIKEMCTDKTTATSRGIIHQIRRIIGTNIRGDRKTAEEYFRRLMNTLESDLVTFSTYAGSQAYRVRHQENWENKQDAGAFHFVG
ncbi:MAG: hypothetical protein IJG07_05610 [Prevotella sp.]|nr:hypothetical protein [Prevotella sp.]